jgi:predicted alpha/beta superfamily hydrolase
MERSIFAQEKYQVSVFKMSATACPCVYCMVDADSVQALAEQLSGQKLVLVTVSGMDWEKDLSPWPAPRAFRGGKDFGGGADDYLDLFLQKILPCVEGQLAFSPAYRAVAGYSLAGLWALYAAYRTKCFQRLACVSGSLWYDGFLDFMRRHSNECAADRVYFSLGDREKVTKNQRMAVVEEQMRKAADLLSHEGINTVFEQNPGGHFQEPVERLSKGIRWILED